MATAYIQKRRAAFGVYVWERDKGEIEHEICNESVTDNLVNWEELTARQQMDYISYLNELLSFVLI